MTRTFTIFGKVKGKQSARTFWLKDKFGNPIKPVTTSHPDTRTYESLIQEAYLAVHRREAPFDCALELRLRIFLAVPKSWSKKKRELCLTGGAYPTKTPDNSNVLKAVEDSLNGVAFIDDKQIVDHHITKRYGEVEKMIIEIIPMEIPDELDK